MSRLLPVFALLSLSWGCGPTSPDADGQSGSGSTGDTDGTGHDVPGCGGTDEAPCYNILFTADWWFDLVGDFNGDGLTDVYDMPRVLLNEGSGDFSEIDTEAVGTPYVAGDLDEDGDDEIVIYADEFLIYDYDGSEEGFRLTAQIPSPLELTLDYGLTGDFDGDGTSQELLIMGSSVSTFRISMLSQVAGEWVAGETRHIEGSLEPTLVAARPVVADVDQDGADDILVPLGSGELGLLRGSPDPEERFTQVTSQFSTPVLRPQPVDLDPGVGLDLALGSSSDQRILLAHNTGSAFEEWMTLDPVPLRAWTGIPYQPALTTADVDADGRREILVALLDIKPSENGHTQDILVAEIDIDEGISVSATKVAGPCQIEKGSFSRLRLWNAELNGDGTPDLILSVDSGLGDDRVSGCSLKATYGLVRGAP